MTRLLPQVDPQQARSPQNERVRGPQSAMDVVTWLPLQRLVVVWRCPHVRRARLMPHWSGRVMSQQAWDALGHACCMFAEWQVPQAPVPVVPHGPQALPQQNQEPSQVIEAMRSASPIEWAEVRRCAVTVSQRDQAHRGSQVYRCRVATNRPQGCYKLSTSVFGSVGIYDRNSAMQHLTLPPPSFNSDRSTGTGV